MYKILINSLTYGSDKNFQIILAESHGDCLKEFSGNIYYSIENILCIKNNEFISNLETLKTDSLNYKELVNESFYAIYDRIKDLNIPDSNSKTINYIKHKIETKNIFG